MKFMDRVYAGNTIEEWMVALGISIVSLLFFYAIQYVFVRRLKKLAQRTANELDDLVVELLNRTHPLFFVVMALYVGLFGLELSSSVIFFANKGVVVALLIQGAIWGNAGITFWITRTTQRKLADDPSSATTLAGLRFVSQLALYSIVLLLALDNFGVDVTALVAGLGVGGIAVALALQNILGDLFASLSIVLDKPFVLGDFIIVGDYLGTVEHIGLKTTRIRSLSGEQVVFSNSDLLKSRIRNYKRMFERRIVFTIGVTYKTSYEKLANISGILRGLVESKELTRFDRAHFKEYGDSSLVFEVVYYVKSPDYTAYMDIQQAINLELYKKFQEEGIEFAYPTRTVYVASESVDEPQPGIPGTLR